MRIFIIGSQGFIGSHLCDYFIGKGYEVYGADLAESHANSAYSYFKVSRLSHALEELFNANTFDFCINASGSGNVYYSMTHPIEDFEANAFDVIKILDAIRKYNQSCKFVHISSAAVYGNPLKLPIIETDALHPISPYGYHKMISEIICKEYATLFGISVAIIRPFSIFGTRLRKQLFWDISVKLKQADSITLFGTGFETRDFIHISDFVLLIERVMSNTSFEGEVFNAAAGREIAINEVTDIFECFYERQKKIIFNGCSKPGDPINWRADIDRIKNIGFVATADFKKEVLNYIRWFNQVYDK